MKYIIPGDPIPLMRARSSHNSSRPWDPQKKSKASTGIYIARDHCNRPYYQGPLELNITFFFPKEKKEGQYHYQKPDLSNLIKFIEDVAESILYDNDCTIASIVAQKLWAKESRTEFTITELTNG